MKSFERKLKKSCPALAKYEKFQEQNRQPKAPMPPQGLNEQQWYVLRTYKDWLNKREALDPDTDDALNPGSHTEDPKPKKPQPKLPPQRPPQKGDDEIDDQWLKNQRKKAKKK